MAERKPPYSTPSIERIAPFFATSSAKMPGFLGPSNKAGIQHSGEFGKVESIDDPQGAVGGRSELGGKRAFDCIDKATALRLAQDFGTPFILVDEACLKARWNSFREDAAGAQVFLPYKSSPIAFFRRYFATQGLGSEVASGLEFEAALSHNVAGERIILNQPVRDLATFERAISLGAVIVADGVEDVGTLAAIRTNRPVRVLLRVNARNGSREGWSRFGMPLGSDELAEAIRLAATCDSLEVLGLHSHLGTNIPSSETYSRAVERLAECWQALESLLGHPLRVLDLGGGFASPSACPIRKPFADWQPDPPASVLAAARKALDPAGLAGRVQLWLEPGRILVEDTAVLVSKVVDVRAGPIGRQVTCDSGVNQVSTAGYLRHPIARINNDRVESPGLLSGVLFGSLCMESDVIAADCALPADLAVGDLLKIGAVGSYDLAFAFPFIHGRCPILLRRSDGAIECLRRREVGADFHLLDEVRCASTC